MFYLIAMMFLAYEIDRFFRPQFYIQLIQDIEHFESDEVKSTLSKHARKKLWTNHMTFISLMSFCYMAWGIVGLFSELKLYYAWICLPPALGMIMGKDYRDKIKDRRDKLLYKITTNLIFGVIPLIIILYFAWERGVQF